MKPAALFLALGLALGGSPAAFAQAPAAALAPSEVQLKLPGGGTYIGTVSNGVPDGKGYFKDPDGTQYEGEVHMGRRTGLAEAMFRNGDRYKGEWKDGQPDGKGTMTYMVGGAFEGRWRQGVPDGRGIMSFAGSGRRAEVGFLNGERLDAAPPPPPDKDEAKQKYALRDANAPVGSHLAHKVSTSAIPMNVGWEALTPSQQQYVRKRYPTLDAGDEPPYPVHGPQAFYAKLADLAGKYYINDELIIYVLVGADGKVVSVTSIGLDDPEARRLAGVLAGLVKYKPARCSGQPCQMMAPFHMKLSVSY